MNLFQHRSKLDRFQKKTSTPLRVPAVLRPAVLPCLVLPIAVAMRH